MGDLDHLIQYLPQKPPFLFVDEVLEQVPFERARGAVRFEAGHRIFENHLPGEPLVPGVIIIEALAQLAGLALIPPEGKPIRGYLGEVCRMRFRRTVGPGSRLEIEARLVQRFGRAARFEVRALAGGSLIADGEIVVAEKK